MDTDRIIKYGCGTKYRYKKAGSDIDIREDGIKYNVRVKSNNIINLSSLRSFDLLDEADVLL